MIRQRDAAGISGRDLSTASATSSRTIDDHSTPDRPGYPRISQRGTLALSRSGTPLTYDGLLLLMRRLGEKTGLHVHPHKFRHSFAVNALRNDAREFDIQDFLGHATLVMTKRYARQTSDDLARRHKLISPADRLRTSI